MKEKTLSIFEVQNQLINLPNQLASSKWRVVIAICDGKPALAILSYVGYKNLLEAINALHSSAG